MPERASTATHLSLLSSGVAVATTFACWTIHEAAFHGPDGPNAKYFALEGWVVASPRLADKRTPHACGSRPSSRIARLICTTQ